MVELVNLIYYALSLFFSFAFYFLWYFLAFYTLSLHPVYGFFWGGLFSWAATKKVEKMEMTGLSKVSLKAPNFSLCSGIRQRRTGSLPRSRTWSTVVKSMSTNNSAAIPIMVNSCNGQMGKAVIRAADSAGLQILPVSIGPAEESGNTVQVYGKKMQMLGPKDRESVLASLFDEHPNLIVVDFTVPAAVNDNADLYCKIGVPFVMGTTGGDRNRLYKTVEDSQVYAVISPQMGKPVVAFLAAMEYMAEKCPGVFSGYSLQVMESHQTGKLDTSGTAKAVISCFQKMGVSFDVDQVQMIRDPKQQLEMVGVPDEYLFGHAFHMYHLTSPDQTVSLEFQHNVCGRSVYAEGAVDAVIFLANKVQSKAEKHIYDMIDVLREGKMR